MRNSTAHQRSSSGSGRRGFKGQRMLKHQQYKAQLRHQNKNKLPKRVLTQQARDLYKKMQRYFWRRRHVRGKYMPHQGHAEMARRRRQMAEHVCINTEAWV